MSSTALRYNVDETYATDTLWHKDRVASYRNSFFAKKFSSPALSSLLGPQSQSQVPPIQAAQVRHFSNVGLVEKTFGKAIPIAADITPRSYLQPLQEWEGYVLGLQDDYFSANLVDLATGDTAETHHAEFLLSDVAESDGDLVKPGALFRWVVGYLRDGSGTKTRASRITFRRLPAWSKRDLAKIKAEAVQIASELVWE